MVRPQDYGASLDSAKRPWNGLNNSHLLSFRSFCAIRAIRAIRACLLELTIVDTIMHSLKSF